MATLAETLNLIATWARLKRVVGVRCAELSRSFKEMLPRALLREPGCLLFQLGASRSPSELAAHRRKFGPIAVSMVRVSLQSCLVRELALPAAAYSRFDDIIRIDLDRSLPFPPNSVFSDWYIIGARNGTYDIRQVILKRSLIIPIIDSLGQARIPLRGIEVVDGDTSLLPVNLLPRSERRQAPGLVWLRRIIFGQAMVIAILAATWFFVSATNLSQAIADRERLVELAKGQMLELRKSHAAADQLEVLMHRPRQRRAERLSPLVVWEELSRVLPDSTWLTTIRYDDKTVHIEGQSANAAELPPLLGRSNAFSHIEFASPVTRDSARGIERFQIRMQITHVEPAQK